MARLFKRAPWRQPPGKLGKQKFVPSYASPDVSITLTGQSVTASAGNVLGSVAYSISGSAITSAIGDVTESVSYSLGGQEITASTGTVSVTTGSDVSITLTGQAISASAGTLSSAIAYSVSGSSSAFSAGTVTNSVSYDLSGQQISLQSGDLTASTAGDVTIELVGQSISISQGSVSVSGGDSSGIKPAGRPKRSQTRRRAIIEIDGQEFFVSSEEEAQALLDKAIEESERIAAIKAEEVVNKRRQRQKRDGYLNKSPIKIDKPEISFDNGVDYAQELMHAFNRKLDEIYRKAAEEAEISLLIKNKIEEEDDEAITYLLL